MQCIVEYQNSIFLFSANKSIESKELIQTEYKVNRISSSIYNIRPQKTAPFPES